MSGRCGEAMARRARGRALARALLPRGLHTAGRRIAAIAYQNKAVVYDLLFRAAAETVLTIAADPKHLGARIGITAVLHTWGSTMTHHPHVHMIVPGGGISLDGSRWVSCRPRFFLPVPVFSNLFRGLMLAKLLAAHKAGQLKFFGQHAHLAERKAFAAYLAPLRKRKWYLYSKPPFGGPEAVLAYLSRYTHRVAISNRRLIAFDHNGVTFKYKDYRADGRARYKVMTLATASSSAASSSTSCRRASTASATTDCSPRLPCGQYRAGARIARGAVSPERTRAGRSCSHGPSVLLRPCPCCGGRMIIIETFARGCQPSTNQRRQPSSSGSIHHDAGHCRSMTVLTLAFWPAPSRQRPGLRQCTRLVRRRDRQSPHTPCAPLVRTHAVTLLVQKADRTSAPLQPPQAIPRRPNPHSACGAAAAPSPAISCLGAFRPPAAERVERFVIAGSRKPAQQRSLPPFAERALRNVCRTAAC